MSLPLVATNCLILFKN